METKMKMVKKITANELSKAFNTDFSEFMLKKISETDLSYFELSTEERDSLMLTVVETLLDPSVKKSGAHRINDWIRGWGENRDEFRIFGNYDSLIPKYFGKLPYVRWKQDFIKAADPSLEYNMARVLQYWIFEKHFTDLDSVYEFGCGTGHNLLRVNEVNSTCSIYGLDWASSSQDTIKQINKIYGKDFTGHKFDFFNPDYDFKLDNNSGVYTFAALEQTSDKFHGFIDYLVDQKPSICVHIEPMWEYLDNNNLIDFLSIKYFDKRNYLNGLSNYLHELQDSNKIEIIQDQRSYIGSMFIDGYSIIAWRPKNA